MLKIKIEISRVISATESESEESERFHFLASDSTSDSVVYDSMKTRLPESKAKEEG